MFKKISHNRMYENIVNQIIEAIHRGDLKPNDKLQPEKELEKIFGVSRVTVREAIRSLEQFGIVEVLQGSHGGAYIKEINLDTVFEQTKDALRMTNITLLQVREARIILEETLLTKLTPKTINDSFINRLQQNIDTTEEYIKKNDFNEWHQCNIQFHMLIAEMIKNPIITMLYKLILVMMFDFYKNVNPTALMAQKGIKSHKKIVEHIKNGDLLKAVDECSFHIRKASTEIAKKSKRQSLIGKK